MNLEQLLYPITIEQFFSEYWNKRSLLIPGNKSKVEDLFSWDEINRIVKEHRLQPPQIRLAHEGKSSDDLQFMRTRITPRGTIIHNVDIPVLYRLLREGASLVLDAVDEAAPKVSDFCEELGRDFKCQFSVNAYAAWGNVPGFGTHWDDHDLFVVQIDGRKHWRLHGVTREFPLDKDFEQNPEPDNKVFEWEAIVNPGDVIYIPRGHWHGATAINEPTLHLTCGMNNPTGIELLSFLADEMRAFKIGRMDIPRFATEEVKSQYFEEMKSKILDLLNDDFLTRYVDYWAGHNQARTHISLPFAGFDDTIPSDNDFIIGFAGISHSPLRFTEKDTFVFQAMGKEIELFKDSFNFCQLILSGKKCHFNELLETDNGRLNIKSIKKILDILVKHGIIYISR